MSKAVANNIQAMMLIREMFIKAEADETIKQALKQTVFKDAGQINKGDWI